MSDISDDAGSRRSWSRSGWLVDTLPASSEEFRVSIDRHSFEAKASSEAFGRMDLLTGVTMNWGTCLAWIITMHPASLLLRFSGFDEGSDKDKEQKDDAGYELGSTLRGAAWIG